MSSEQIYFNAFNLISGIGPITLKKLLGCFRSLEEAWQASEYNLKLAGLEDKTIQKIINNKSTIQPEKEWKKLLQENIGLITINDPIYPSALKEIYSAPAALYIKGELHPQDQLAIAVVGTRRPSPYGQQLTPQITTSLVQNGLTIISGLAYGIDTLAHEAALRAGGRTIAVLGSGLDQKSIYPPTNRKLAEKISQQGAIISEYPLGTPAHKQNFPARNRIISGLSLGILVIEAAEKSGALITAQHALEQNREVFAIPGSIYNPNSAGPNNLIKIGAKLVAGPNDILEELNLPLPLLDTRLESQRSISALSVNLENETEKLIIKNLSHEPLHIDKISELTKLDASIVNSILTMMEIKGIIKNLGGMNFVIS